MSLAPCGCLVTACARRWCRAAVQPQLAASPSKRRTPHAGGSAHPWPPAEHVPPHPPGEHAPGQCCPLHGTSLGAGAWRAAAGQQPPEQDRAACTRHLRGHRLQYVSASAGALEHALRATALFPSLQFWQGLFAAHHLQHTIMLGLMLVLKQPVSLLPASRRLRPACGCRHADLPDHDWPVSQGLSGGHGTILCTDVARRARCCPACQ